MAHALFLARAALAATLLSSAALSSAGELAVYRFTDTLQSAETDPLSVAGNFSLHVRPPLTGNAAFSTVGADRVARFGFVGMPPTTPSPLARARADNFFSSFTVTPEQDQALNLDSLDFRLSNNFVATTPNLAG